MTRRVVTLRYETLDKADEVDTYFDKVVKYIPTDIVAAWVAVTGIVKGAANINPATTLWIAFVAGVAITFVWTWRQTSKSGQPPVWKQIIISTFAFVVWVIALGGPPFELNSAIGAILLIGFTLVAALFDP